MAEEKIESMEEYDPDQGERIIGKYITKDMARWYFSMFWGHEDVFAKRGSKGGYFPQCDNRWNSKICPKQRGEKMICDACEHTNWTKLAQDKIIAQLTQNKTERFIYLLKLRQEAGVDVTVITTEPENIAYGSAEFCIGMIENMKLGGIHVILKEEIAKHFAIIDEELVWHGGMNLLGKEDVWDNLM